MIKKYYIKYQDFYVCWSGDNKYKTLELTRDRELVGVIQGNDINELRDEIRKLSSAWGLSFYLVVVITTEKEESAFL